MKYLLQIYPADGEFEGLSEEEQGAIVGEYVALRQSPGVIGGDQLQPSRPRPSASTTDRRFSPTVRSSRPRSTSWRAPRSDRWKSSRMQGRLETREKLPKPRALVRFRPGALRRGGQLYLHRYLDRRWRSWSSSMRTSSPNRMGARPASRARRRRSTPTRRRSSRSPSDSRRPWPTSRVSAARRGRRILDGGGSGVVISPDGFLLTSAHVVARSDSRGHASFADGRNLDVEVVGADPLSDLAVLRANGGDLVPAELGEAEAAARRPARRRDRESATDSRARSRRASSPRSAARCRGGRARRCESRQRHPDRRGAESRQLRRRARRQPRPGGRHQHRHRRDRSRPGRSNQRSDAPDRRGADTEDVSQGVPRHRRRRAPASTTACARAPRTMRGGERGRERRPRSPRWTASRRPPHRSRRRADPRHERPPAAHGRRANRLAERLHRRARRARVRAAAGAERAPRVVPIRRPAEVASAVTAAL